MSADSAATADPMKGKPTEEQPIEGLAITAFSAMTPVGATMEQSCAAMRAGIGNIGQHRFFDAEGSGAEAHKASVGAVPGLDPQLDGHARLEQLLQYPVDCLLTKLKALQVERFDVILLIADDPSFDSEQDHELVMALTDVMALDNAPDLIRGERCELLDAFSRARQGLDRDAELDGIVVIAVDSLLTESRLEGLKAAARLKTPSYEGGLIPGEGAVICLVQREADLEVGQPRLRLQAFALGEESNPMISERDSIGDGVTRAWRDVRQQLEHSAQAACDPRSQKPLSYTAIYSDLNGEDYRADEWALVFARVSDDLSAVQQHQHVADHCGDVGVASGALLLARAFAAFERGYELSVDEGFECASIIVLANDNAKRAVISVCCSDGMGAESI